MKIKRCPRMPRKKQRDSKRPSEQIRIEGSSQKTFARRLKAELNVPLSPFRKAKPRGAPGPVVRSRKLITIDCPGAQVPPGLEDLGRSTALGSLGRVYLPR